MAVNFWGAAEISHAVMREWTRSSAPAFEQPKHFVFTSSMVGMISMIGYAPYAPSKWALRGLADAMAQEALLFERLGKPVRVHVVYPGSILSPGYERENKTKPDITVQLEKDEVEQTPNAVASAAIKGLQAGRNYVTVSFLGELIRMSALGGSNRNNWIVDTLGAWFTQIVWFFVIWSQRSEIISHAKKHGHPDTQPRKS
jgi:3-dehydrosphinganine reductase